MSVTNNNNKYTLKKDVLTQINNSETIALISVSTGVKFSTLKRQITENHEYLTLYKVLVAISLHTGKSIDRLLKQQ